ncbi:MAG: hypothetical protein KC729_12085, partial [Candidatus Eisenbacteria bacterium]|nr:hypothetical protein [Candidatus Eisenbacteria bacterium]
FAPSQWKVYLDGELVFTHPYTGSFFESLRVNLTGENETDAVAIDNLRVYGTNHVCCLGEECIITNERDCEGLGGVHHRELDSCSPDNPCGPPTPVEDRSWGAIKAIHR